MEMIEFHENKIELKKNIAHHNFSTSDQKDHVELRVRK